MERAPFEIGSYYHIYNRGTEKRQIFLNERQYQRFIHYLYVCNDEWPIEKVQNEEITTFNTNQKHKRERLVDIIAFTLMPNHFHLLLSPIGNHGLSKFMQKLQTGYTMYFNKNVKRSGGLFQGLFKSKEVIDEQYLPILARYIHLNPTELMGRDRTTSAKNAISFLREYKWSSCSDYLGVKNYPSVINPDLFWEIFEDEREHKDFLIEGINGWLENNEGSFEVDEFAE